MDLDEVFREIDSLQPEAVEALKRFVAVPSVSARGECLEAGADVTAALARSCGLDVQTWSGPGAPVVFGERTGPAGAPTLLLYGHYDVQPPEPLDAWETPPFEATLRDDAVYGRGAGDNKGQLLAHLTAIRALLASGGCPVSIKLLVEGEEEIGSPHLGEIVRKNRRALAADLVITADGPYHDDGRPVVIFGVRGLLYLELVARGARADLHSGNRGGWAPSAGRLLVEAIARLLGPGGRVCLPGFEEAVRPPTAAERRLLERLPFDRGAILDELGLDSLPPEAEKAPWEALMFRPVLNVAGLEAGHTGPGAKTVIPCRATAKLDFRLVPDQQPGRIENAVRRSLEDLPVEVNRLAAVPPSDTPVDNPWTAPVVEALEQATGDEPWQRPRLGGTTPDWVFTRILETPSLLVPYGPPDMHHHAPNERMDLESLRRGCRCTAAICHAVATATSS